MQILSDVINDLAGSRATSRDQAVWAGHQRAGGLRFGQLAPKLAKVDGVEDLYNGIAEPSAEMAMEISGPEANRIGLTPGQVSQQAQSALLGTEAGEMRLDDRALGVRVRAPDSVRFNPRHVAAMPIVSPDGRSSVPLGALATFQPAGCPQRVAARESA